MGRKRQKIYSRLIVSIVFLTAKGLRREILLARPPGLRHDGVMIFGWSSPTVNSNERLLPALFSTA